MGEWEGEGWRWIFKWIKKLFAWEEDLVGDLLVVVNQSPLRANTRDVRNVVGQRMEKDSSPSYLGRLPWRNRAPPRAQLHLWFILQGILNTKERLHRLKFAGIEDDRCALCMEEPETIDHLFFSCKISSRFWYFCCNQWNLSLCLPKHTRMCLLSWFGNPFKNFDKQLWISMFYVITWSIWDIRNKIIFQAFMPNWEFEKRRHFWRLGIWVKGWCPDFPFSPMQAMEIFGDIRGWKTPRYPSKGLVLELP
ncbi:uncharacterized protein LOC125194617 [Salvia hispanica]|uniref:uncharacterized protein LOC125194617 n=1 Tax=Salvia hispanica TaxID=49212 RepID=UPI0020091404|nr:uncharacterized protein LOC125194617 [Salvia hispanica]